LQYLDISPGFFRLLVKFSAVAHILGDILAPQAMIWARYPIDLEISAKTPK